MNQDTWNEGTEDQVQLPKWLAPTVLFTDEHLVSAGEPSQETQTGVCKYQTAITGARAELVGIKAWGETVLKDKKASDC